jgi:predicted glycoside hydrolase/deacetylase ChbG (UPF0249 family)
MVRSTTLIANGEAFEGAVKIAGERENLGTGIHFALTGFKPLSPPQKLPGLVGPDGTMPSGPFELLKEIAGGKITRDVIRRELLAQAEKVFDSGIIPTHFDSHKHVHIIPAVLESVIEIARRFSVKWIRMPFEARGAWRFWFDIEKGKRAVFLKQFAVARASTAARPVFIHMIRRAGLRTPARFYGISPTGLFSEKIIRRICGMMAPGLNELMTHPGIVDDALVRRKSRLLDSRRKERDFLVSPEVKKILEKNAVTLTHFGEVNVRS